MTQLANDGRLMAYPEAPVDGYDPAFYDPRCGSSAPS